MDNNRSTKNVLFSTPLLKALDFLLSNPEVEFSDARINEFNIGIKKSALNLALRTLATMELIKRKSKGRTSTNRLNQVNPIVIYLKIISNLLEVMPFVDSCKEYAYEIVLFGSRASGMHSSDSDFDIYVVSDNKEEILKKISQISFPIQPIIKSPEEAIGLNREEPALANAISQGIVLWEK